MTVLVAARRRNPLARAGDERKSADALARFMHHYPGVTTEKIRQGLPPSLEVTNQAYLEGMRKAGIPES
jgi:hypothetical protein